MLNRTGDVRLARITGMEFGTIADDHSATGIDVLKVGIAYEDNGEQLTLCYPFNLVTPALMRQTLDALKEPTIEEMDAVRKRNNLFTNGMLRASIAPLLEYEWFKDWELAAHRDIQYLPTESFPHFVELHEDQDYGYEVTRPSAKDMFEALFMQFTKSTSTTAPA